MKEIILASKSQFRARMLKNAGLDICQQAADLDERSIEQPLIKSQINGGDIAAVLAIEKARHVSNFNQDSIVIGSDQTLVFDGKLLHKPTSMAEAQARLLDFSGRAHELNSAVAMVQNGEILWRHVDHATITFRKLSPEFISSHLADVGEKILSSVGAYQIEA